MLTEYIYWDSGHGYREKDLVRAVEILRSGGLVAFPTETVYGLGGNAWMKEAAERIYQAKGRPSDNPLILHISKLSDLEALVKRMPKSAEPLMEAFWPGPMTLIFEKSEEVPREVTGGLNTVAVRMPEHPAARELIDRTGVPIAAPSANLSGRPSPTSAGHVREDLDGRISMIIDGGEVGIGIESTILDLTEEIPLILRPGHVTADRIQEVVGSVRADPALLREDSPVPPRAPGMKYRHYAPKAQMTVIEGKLSNIVERICLLASAYPSEKVGILASEETKERYPHGQVVVAGSRQNRTIAGGLYAALREFDHLGVEVIFSEGFSEEEGSEGIMNRLVKAAGHQVEYLSKK